MSGTGSDPFAPVPPGEEDDLQSELDAWDRTFDALHATDEASKQPTGELASTLPPSEPGIVVVRTEPAAAAAAVAPGVAQGTGTQAAQTAQADADAFTDEEPTRAM
ncbi:MAG TPA: hypothetical protein VHE35_10095, partial [Kofleriaceae bacterium]|nr:hypothetical protein [Kofleriaceae bacterium]